MRRISLIGALAGAIACQSAFAGDLFLKSQRITVDGIADIASGNVARARKTAIINAQRNAIEQVLGAAIESQFSASQRETLKGDHADFMSRVQDKVKSQSKGFVEGYKLVSEKREGRTFRVRLVVTVKADSLKAELAQLDALLSSVGNPKLMILAAEHFTGSDGNKSQITPPTVTALIENSLLERGFPMVDKARQPETSEVSAALGDAVKAAKLGKRFGAEVAVIGSVEVKHTAHNAFGQGMHYTAARVNLRAVNVSNGKVLTSFEAMGKGVGASTQLARVKSVRAATPKAINNLLSRLVTAWKAEADKGKRFLIGVRGLKSYGRQARPFIKAMKKLSGVQAVKELSFKKGTLELDVLFKGSKDDLMGRVFDDIAANDTFADLDKVEDSGTRIVLKL